MTAYRPVLRCNCKLKQNANEDCNSCATVVQVLQDLIVLSFIERFVLFVIAPLGRSTIMQLIADAGDRQC